MGGFSMDFTDIIVQYFLEARSVVQLVIVVLVLATSFFIVQFIAPAWPLKRGFDASIRKPDEVKKTAGRCTVAVWQVEHRLEPGL